MAVEIWGCPNPAPHEHDGYYGEDDYCPVCAALEKDALLRAVEQDRDEYEAMIERIAPESVRDVGGTKQEVERWIKSRININYERLGRACMDAIIEGGMIHADPQEPSVLIWNGNAAEQIGEHLRRANIARTPPERSEDG